jgi:hypothetical protein
MHSENNKDFLRASAYQQLNSLIANPTMMDPLTIAADA